MNENMLHSGFGTLRVVRQKSQQKTLSVLEQESGRGLMYRSRRGRGSALRDQGEKLKAFGCRRYRYGQTRI
jgi:hypothetical protein